MAGEDVILVLHVTKRKAKEVYDVSLKMVLMEKIAIVVEIRTGCLLREKIPRLLYIYERKEEKEK